MSDDPDELQELVIDQVIRVLAVHQLPDFAFVCKGCGRKLYAQGGGETLAHHRAKCLIENVEFRKLITEYIAREGDTANDAGTKAQHAPAQITARA